MSWKAYLMAGGSVLILLLVSNFITWKISKNVYSKVELVDTIYIKGDTITIEKPTEVFVIKYVDRIIEHKINDSLFVTQLDTLIVSDKDTIEIDNTIMTRYPNSLIDFVQIITHKDYESFRVDSLFIPVETIKYIEEPRFFMDTFLWGSGLTILTIIILVLLL